MIGGTRLIGAPLAVLMALSAAAHGPRLVYVGTRADGPGSGIVAARLEPQKGALARIGTVAELPRATWLLAGPRRSLLAVAGSDGIAKATVASFRLDPATGQLLPLSRVPSGGVDATFLAMGSPPATVLVANYGSGTVAALPIALDGTLSPPIAVQADVGSGPHPRQNAPHAHGIAVAPGGDYVVVSDLGADRIFVYRFDRSAHRLEPAATPFTQAPAGSGPRHAVFSRDGRFLWVNSELSAEIATYRWDGATGALTQLRRISTLPQDYTGKKAAGEIVLSPNGRFLYATNRGEDTIVAYRVDAATGELGEVQRIASGGKAPWAIAFDGNGRWLLAANEGSDRIDLFAADPRTGMLRPTGANLAVAHPTSIVILRD